MAVGDSALVSTLSYLAVGRSATSTGAYNTCTAGIDFLSASLKVVQETKILEQLERSRTYSKSILMGKVIEGELEAYVVPRITATGFLLQNVFGGTVTNATAATETIGAGANSAIVHTFNLGSMDQSYPSMNVNLRKGPVTTGKVFEYSGVRVSEFGLTAEIDEALKMNMGFICKDETNTTNDIESVLTFTTADCLSFVNGRFSIESTFASLTSSSFWHVQSVNFSINNNLKSDAESRRIGSDTLAILPPTGIANFELNATVRYNTTTAYDAMKAATTLYGQFEFLGNTMSGSNIQEGLKLTFAKLKIMDSGDPEIGGPDEILQSEVTFAVLRDDSSATGYAVQAELTNDIANYD